MTTHLDPTKGRTNIDLEDTDTDTTPGIYICDVQIKDAGGKIRSSEQFIMDLVGDVTRRTS